MPLLLLLRPLGQALLPLLRKRDTYYVAAIVVLAVAAWSLRGKVRVLELTLATKATVVEQKHESVDKDVKVDTRKEQGRVKIVREYVQVPGSCTSTLARETEEHEPVVTVIGRTEATDRKTDIARSETPACPQFAPRTWGLGGGFDPRNRDRGSVTLSKSFGDLTVGLGHNVGAGARPGDVSVSASIKVW